MILANSLVQVAYMVAEDETEEALIAIAMRENISLTSICEIIDANRSAGCGFARAARIFSQTYMKAVSMQELEKGLTPRNTFLAMKRAMASVANDGQEAEQD